MKRRGVARHGLAGMEGTILDAERIPIEDVATLAEQDKRDMLSGYIAGLHGRDEPGIEFNRAFWHGWRNGMVDSGSRQVDAAQMKLVNEFVKAPNGRR